MATGNQGLVKLALRSKEEGGFQDSSREQACWETKGPPEKLSVPLGLCLKKLKVEWGLILEQR